MNEPLVSVIVLNYNGKNDLEECFDALYNLNYKNVEFILVDNNSQDNSVEIVKTKYKEVKIIKLEKNYGFAEGNNIGAQHANGKYFALLNMDTKVDKNWISELVKVAEKSKDIGIVGSKNYYYYNRPILSFGFGLCDKYGNTKNIGLNKKDSIIVNRTTECFYHCGASLLISRELYNNIKLFDPVYFAYYEDVDLCWRALINGYNVVYAPKSILYHKIGVTDLDDIQKKYWLRRNKLRSILKNYEKKTILQVLPIIFYGWLMLVLSSIFRRERKYALKFMIIYFKSLIWNILHLKSLIRERMQVQERRTKNDKYLLSLIKKFNDNLKENVK